MNIKQIDIIMAIKQALVEHRNENECFSAPVAESVAQRVVSLLQESDNKNRKVLLD